MRLHINLPLFNETLEKWWTLEKTLERELGYQSDYVQRMCSDWVGKSRETYSDTYRELLESGPFMQTYIFVKSIRETLQESSWKIGCILARVEQLDIQLRYDGYEPPRLPEYSDIVSYNQGELIINYDVIPAFHNCCDNVMESAQREHNILQETMAECGGIIDFSDERWELEQGMRKIRRIAGYQRAMKEITDCAEELEEYIHDTFHNVMNNDMACDDVKWQNLATSLTNAQIYQVGGMEALTGVWNQKDVMIQLANTTQTQENVKTVQTSDEKIGSSQEVQGEDDYYARTTAGVADIIDDKVLEHARGEITLEDVFEIMFLIGDPNVPPEIRKELNERINANKEVLIQQLEEYWNNDDGYFEPGWWSDEMKAQEALYCLYLETMFSDDGCLDVGKILMVPNVNEPNPKVSALQLLLLDRPADGIVKESLMNQLQLSGIRIGSEKQYDSSLQKLDMDIVQYYYYNHGELTKWAEDNDKKVLSFAIDFIPYIGEFKATSEVILGKDMLTGEELSTNTRIFMAACILFVEATKILSQLDEIPKLSKRNRLFGGRSSGGGTYSYKEVNIHGKINTELDEVDLVNKIIYEDKSAGKLYMDNPDFPQTEGQWAYKQIYKKGVNRIEAINQSEYTLSIVGSENVPNIDSLRSIKDYVFRIDADTPELRQAVEQELTKLKIKYPEYNFSAIYGGN